MYSNEEGNKPQGRMYIKINELIGNKPKLKAFILKKFLCHSLFRNWWSKERPATTGIQCGGMYIQERVSESWQTQSQMQLPSNCSLSGKPSALGIQRHGSFKRLCCVVENLRGACKQPEWQEIDRNTCHRWAQRLPRNGKGKGEQWLQPRTSGVACWTNTRGHSQQPVPWC